MKLAETAMREAMLFPQVFSPTVQDFSEFESRVRRYALKSAR